MTNILTTILWKQHKLLESQFMKITITSDTHLGVQKYRKTLQGENVFYRQNFKAFQKVLQLASNSDQLIIAGDLFHSYMPNFYDILQYNHIIQHYPKPIHIITGNHDVNMRYENKNIYSFNLLKQLNSANIHYYTSPSVDIINEQGHKTLIAYMPFRYIGDEEFKKLRNQYKEISDPTVTKILVMHGYVESPSTAIYNTGNEKDYQVKQSTASLFDLVIAGHVHLPQKRDIIDNDGHVTQVITSGSISLSNLAPNMVYKSKNVDMVNKVKPVIWFYDTQTHEVSKEDLNLAPLVYKLTKDEYNISNLTDEKYKNSIIILNFPVESFPSDVIENVLEIYSPPAKKIERKQTEIIPDFWEYIDKNFPKNKESLLQYVK